jgi:serine/threonine-protein kinase
MSVPPPAMTPAIGAAVGAATGTLTTAVGASTTGPVTQVARRAQAPSKLPIVLAGVAVVVLATGGIWALTRTPEVAPAAPSAEPSVTAAPEPSAVASEQPDDPAADTKPKRVRVVILPADASIEIEGEPAKAKDGVLDIEGTLGSVHRVRVFKGPGETIADVVVTETGALPPKIEVKAGQKIRLERPGAADATPPPSASPAVPPVPTGIQVDPGEFD